jgi:hypothetical protein
MEKRDILIIALIAGLVLVGIVAAGIILTLTVNITATVPPQPSASINVNGNTYTSTQTIVFNFGTVAYGPNERDAMITNLGNTPLTYTITITGDNAWLTVDSSSGTIPRDSQDTVTFNLEVPVNAPSGTYNYQAVFTVES